MSAFLINLKHNQQYIQQKYCDLYCLSLSVKAHWVRSYISITYLWRQIILNIDEIDKVAAAAFHMSAELCLVIQRRFLLLLLNLFSLLSRSPYWKLLSLSFSVAWTEHAFQKVIHQSNIFKPSGTLICKNVNAFFILVNNWSLCHRVTTVKRFQFYECRFGKI